VVPTTGTGHDFDTGCYSTLDFSFNLLRHIPASSSPDSLSQYPNLKVLFLVQNGIKRIEGLDGLGQSLETLELGGNKIRVRVIYKLEC
jgi:Leucine-rich repeat (LRR) protein